MKQDFLEHIKSLEDRLIAEARDLRQQAETIPPGPAREQLLQRAGQAEADAQTSEWLRAPGVAG